MADPLYDLMMSGMGAAQGAQVPQMDPFEMAAMRQRQTVRPPGGRAGEGPSIRGIFDATPVGMATNATMAGLEFAPEIATGGAAAPMRAKPTKGPTLADILTGSAEGADAAEFKWNDPNQERVNRLKKIDTEIEREASRRTPSAPGTQKARIDSLNAEKEKLMTERGADYEAARGEWTTEQGRVRKEAEDKKWKETSVFDVVPGTRQGITAGVVPLSYYGGKWLGKRLPMAGAIPAGAFGGGLEGFLGQYLPTEMDLGLPRTSKTRQEASGDLQDPGYWARVGAVTGGNAALGAYGAFRGAVGRRMPLPPIGPGGQPPAPQPPMGVSSPSPAAPAALPGGPATPPTTPPAPSALETLMGSTMPQGIKTGAPPQPRPVPEWDQSLNRGLGGWRDPVTGHISRNPHKP